MYRRRVSHFWIRVLVLRKANSKNKLPEWYQQIWISDLWPSLSRPIGQIPGLSWGSPTLEVANILSLTSRWLQFATSEDQTLRDTGFEHV